MIFFILPILLKLLGGINYLYTSNKSIYLADERIRKITLPTVNNNGWWVDKNDAYQLMLRNRFG